MHQKALLVSVIYLLLVSRTGCWYSPVQVVPSSRNVPANAIEKFDARHEAEACRALLLGFIPVSGDNRLETAMSSIVADPNKGWLAEMTVETRTIFWVLGFTECTIVTGYPQKMPDDAYDKLVEKSGTEAPPKEQSEDSATEQPMKPQANETVADQPAGEQSGEPRTEDVLHGQSEDSPAKIPATVQSNR